MGGIKKGGQKVAQLWQALTGYGGEGKGEEGLGGGEAGITVVGGGEVTLVAVVVGDGG